MDTLCFFLLYIGTVSGYVLRDLEDSYGDEVCPVEAPTIARDIHQHYQQRCFASRDIIPTTRLIRTITVYESRMLAMRGCEGIVKVYIYDTFAEKWLGAANFLVTGGHFLVSVTPYTRGKLYAIEFTNCWYLVKVYGMDSFRPTIIPIFRSTSTAGTTRDTQTTPQQSRTTMRSTPGRGSTTTVGRVTTAQLTSITGTTPRTMRSTRGIHRSTTTGRVTATVELVTSTGATPRTMGSTRMTRIVTGGRMTITRLVSTTVSTPRSMGSTVGTVRTMTTAGRQTTAKLINTTPQVVRSTRKTVTRAAKISSTRAITVGLTCTGGGLVILISAIIIYRVIILPYRRVDDNSDDGTTHNDRIGNHSTANSSESGANLNDPGNDPSTEGTDMTVLGAYNTEYDDVSLNSVPSRTILIDGHE